MTRARALPQGGSPRFDFSYDASGLRLHKRPEGKPALEHGKAAVRGRTAAIHIKGSYFPFFPFLPFLLFLAMRITPSPSSACQRSVDRTASTYH